MTLEMPVRWETWVVFLVTETTLCLTPGPAVLLVLSQALRRGSLAAVWSSLGILAGNAFYFVLSATSLGAIVATSYDLFSVVRWIGAAYLLWLGARTFLGRSSVLPVTPGSDAGQFVDPMADVPAQVAVLAVTSIVVEFMVLAAYGGLAGRATSLARRPQFAALTNRVAGSLLIAAGVRTATLRPA